MSDVRCVYTNPWLRVSWLCTNNSAAKCSQAMLRSSLPWRLRGVQIRVCTSLYVHMAMALRFGFRNTYTRCVLCAQRRQFLIHPVCSGAAPKCVTARRDLGEARSPRDWCIVSKFRVHLKLYLVRYAVCFKLSTYALTGNVQSLTQGQNCHLKRVSRFKIGYIYFFCELLTIHVKKGFTGLFIWCKFFLSWSGFFK